MSDLNERQKEINQKMEANFTRFSSSFMELSSALKSLNGSNEIIDKLEKLFKLFLESNQDVNAEIGKLLEVQNKLEKIISQLKEDKRRLEVLYSSGILLSTETETKALIGIAIDTVVRELCADSGFIVLTNQQGEIESVV